MSKASPEERAQDLLDLAWLVTPASDASVKTKEEIESAQFAAFCYALAASQSGNPEIFLQLLKFKCAEFIDATPTLLASRLDLAYEIYQICHLAPNGDSKFQKQIESIKKSALTFMMDVLDVKTTKEVIDGMQDRARTRQYDPEYIPRQKTTVVKKMPDPNRSEDKVVKIGNVEKRISAKTQFRWRKAASTALGAQYRKVMPINIQSFLKDMEKSTIMLTREQRDKHRVHIRKGKFVARAPDNEFHPFDTTKMKSHGKYGFSAFVINTSGEISMFEHNNMADRYAHSSMNAQRPVMAAGEVQIINGKLTYMTDHSGHYQPNALNIYLTLKYFKDHGIDISKTTLLLHGDLSNLGISGSAVDSKDPKEGYVYDANDLFVAMEKIDMQIDKSRRLSRLKSHVDEIVTKHRNELKQDIIELYKIIPYSPGDPLTKRIGNLYHKVIEPVASHKGIGEKYQKIRKDIFHLLPECRTVLINDLEKSIKAVADINGNQGQNYLNYKAEMHLLIESAKSSSTNKNINLYAMIIAQLVDIRERAEKLTAEMVKPRVDSSPLFFKEPAAQNPPVNDPVFTDKNSKKPG
jgi:hypothetical protein